MTRPVEPDPPQPRDIALEQPSPEQLADLDDRSGAEEDQEGG